MQPRARKRKEMALYASIEPAIQGAHERSRIFNDLAKSECRQR